MKKILILTAFEPNKINKNGPSGLIWHISEYLESEGVLVETEIVSQNSFIKKLGVCFEFSFSQEIFYQKYERIITYPISLALYVPQKYRKKCIIIGPDSPSFLFARQYKYTSQNILSDIKNILLSTWFIFFERKILNEFMKIMFVGNNDCRWAKRNNPKKTTKIVYLPHPILTNVLAQPKTIANKTEKEAIVLSGDLSEKYTGSIGGYIKKLILYCKENKLEILVIGKKNYWLYCDLKNKNSNVSYQEWIDDYSEICNPNRYIHLIMLHAGAGTKNRVLTAAASGTLIATTRIGFENIHYSHPPQNYEIFSTPESMIDALNKLASNTNVIQKDSLTKYIERVNFLFKKSLHQEVISENHD